MLGKFIKIVLPFLALVGVVGLIVVAAKGTSMPVIDTRGIVGDSERDTLYLVAAVMLGIVFIVFALLFFIAYRYRETNQKAVYKPEWSSNRLLETVWWGVPIVIIMFFSVVAWQTSHSLDPYRPLTSDKPALNIQVVALQWKWLFIYPDSNIASVGEFAMPVDTPVTFTITSDAPMNSFWIPQLGGQIYAMAGMNTKLNLSARTAGDYRGSSANLSGEGHASMTFIAKAMSDSAFSDWKSQLAKTDNELTSGVYESLRLPSLRDGVKQYHPVDTGLYDSIVGRYSGVHMMGGEMMNMNMGHN